MKQMLNQRRKLSVLRNSDEEAEVQSEALSMELRE